MEAEDSPRREADEQTGSMPEAQTETSTPPYMFNPSGEPITHHGAYVPMWRQLKAHLNNPLAKLLATAQVTKGDDAAETHVAMNSGSFALAPDQEEVFLLEYANALQHGLPFPPFFVEQLTPVFRFFMDFDVALEGSRVTPDSMEVLAQQAQAVVRQFFLGADADVARVIVCTTDNIKIKSAATDTEPGIFKSGIHLLFSRVFVTGQEAMDIYESVVRVFNDTVPPYEGTTWKDVIDAAVYPKGQKGGSALRMLGSRKTDICPDCKKKPALKATCSTCGKNGRVDSGRPYLPLCVLDGDGHRDLAAEEEYANSWLKLLQDTKVRTPAGTTVTAGYTLPEGAVRWAPPEGKTKTTTKTGAKSESKAKAGAKRKRKDDEEDQHEGEQDYLQGIFAAPQKHSLEHEASLLQQLIRKAGEHYADVEVHADGVREDGDKESGTRRFYVYVSGSQYCHNVGREHSSNRIYFHVNRQGVWQYCFSQGECADASTGRSKGTQLEVDLQDPVLLELFPDFVVNDAYAAKVFVKAMGSHIRRDGATVYYYNGKTGLYESDKDNKEAKEAAFRTAVQSKSRYLYFETSRGPQDYAGDTKNVADMHKWVPSMVPDTQFLSIEGRNTAYGKLLFADGILDIRTGEFNPGFDPNIIFTRRIDRCFAHSKPDPAAIAEMRRLLFDDALDPETSTYLIKALCVAVMGDYSRKKYYNGVGEPNCGKGLLVAACRAAFGGFVDEFNANNLIYNPHNGQDEAKQLAWLVDLDGRRLVFSNEVRMEGQKVPELSGTLITSIVSGEDAMKVRLNYQDQRDFVNMATLFLLANDLPKVANASQKAIDERQRVFRYMNYFVDRDPRAPNEKRMDPLAKVRVKEERYKNALVWLMVQTYQQMTEDERKWNGRIHEPPSVIEETKQWQVQQDIAVLLAERYVVTNDPKDTEVVSEELQRYLKEKGVVMSSVKLGMEISKLIKLPAGVAKDVVLGGHKRRRGIRYRTSADDAVTAPTASVMASAAAVDAMLSGAMEEDF